MQPNFSIQLVTEVQNLEMLNSLGERINPNCFVGSNMVNTFKTKSCIF